MLKRARVVFVEYVVTIFVVRDGSDGHMFLTHAVQLTEYCMNAVDGYAICERQENKSNSLC